MASKIGIINSALSQLGEASITALTDVSRAARLAERTYDDLRQDTLRDHPWNFAMKRLSIAASTTAPVWEFAYAYPIPADCLRIVEVCNPSKLKYRVEYANAGTIIATDIAAPLKIKYTTDIEDANAMDSKFREALAARCAMNWAEPLTGTSAKVAQIAQIYTLLVKGAKAVDGQEDSPEIVTSDDWIDARL
ncbi:unnamed protein product [marine sediment metagenome]|uniref:Uncharacterized protein n=1 Tax=marine sediment metagenome TaxID=412755 RepID=X1BY85_9ZZZZ